MLQNINISDEHHLQLVSEAVVNSSKHNEKLAQHKNNLKVNKTETDENQDNSFLIKLRKIQFAHLNQLGAFCSEILEIKQPTSHGHASGSKQTLTHRTFQSYLNCTVIKSKCTHCFVCSSGVYKKSACPCSG